MAKGSREGRKWWGPGGGRTGFNTPLLLVCKR